LRFAARAIFGDLIIAEGTSISGIDRFAAMTEDNAIPGTDRDTEGANEMREINYGPVCNPDGTASDVTRDMLAGTGRDADDFAASVCLRVAIACENVECSGIFGHRGECVPFDEGILNDRRCDWHPAEPMPCTRCEENDFVTENGTPPQCPVSISAARPVASDPRCDRAPLPSTRGATSAPRG